MPIKWRTVALLASMLCVCMMAYMSSRRPDRTAQSASLPTRWNPRTPWASNHTGSSLFHSNNLDSLTPRRSDQVAQSLSPSTDADSFTKMSTHTLSVHGKPDRDSVEYLLNPAYIPNTVYYIWCGKRSLEFHHYLSILSVVRNIHPDSIRFMFEIEPLLDKQMYNLFYKDLKEQHAFFTPVQLNYDDGACKNGAASLNYIRKQLAEGGGWYLHENTLIAEYTASFRNATFIHGLSKTSGHGFVLAQPGYLRIHDLTIPRSNVDTSVKSMACASITEYTEDAPPFCVDLPTVFWPKDIWDLDTAFGRLCRCVFYGSPDIVKARPDYTELVPNIAHMVWIGGGHMDFLFYLSVLSLLYVAEVDCVYIHGSAPTGEYWDKLESHPRVKVILRKPPLTVFGNDIGPLAHMSDLWRVDIMIRYGGIYIDTDVIVVQKFDDLRAYDAVAIYAHAQHHLPYPDILNFGVTLGKRGAPVWRLIKASFKWYVARDWNFNIGRQPYRLLERRPDLIHVEPHLQVICRPPGYCHPTWDPGYHDRSNHHLSRNSIRNWRTDTHAFHWVIKNPVEFSNESELLRSNHTMFGQIGNYVMERAGMLDIASSDEHGQIRMKLSNNLI